MNERQGASSVETSNSGPPDSDAPTPDAPTPDAPTPDAPTLDAPTLDAVTPDAQAPRPALDPSAGPADEASEGHAPHGYVQNKQDYLRRLRRIEGQARGLQRMITDDEYCIDILTQISATTRALQSVAVGLLDEHLHHCVATAVAEGGQTAQDKLDEASAAISRLVRS